MWILFKESNKCLKHPDIIVSLTYVHDYPHELHDINSINCIALHINIEICKNCINESQLKKKTSTGYYELYKIFITKQNLFWRPFHSFIYLSYDDPINFYFFIIKKQFKYMKQ